MMNAVKGLIRSLALAALLGLATGPGYGAEIGEKAALQAAMQQQIDRSLVNGVFLHLNTDNGEIQRLYPQDAHPLILRMDDYFILCTNFKDIDGKSVNVDYYISRDGESLVVFHTAVDDREFLLRWISEGKAKRFE